MRARTRGHYTPQQDFARCVARDSLCDAEGQVGWGNVGDEVAVMAKTSILSIELRSLLRFFFILFDIYLRFNSATMYQLL